MSASVLSEHSEARKLHLKGLTAALGGDYSSAHGCFENALGFLPPDRTHDDFVQAARVTRDDGFTYVRQALVAKDITLLPTAKARIVEAVSYTASLISGLTVTGSVLAQPHGTPKKSRREVFAEHGLTISLLGRVATVGAVMNGLDTRGDSEQAEAARNVEQQPYGLAHDMLRLGNNGYYRVGNALAGARQERLNGRLPHMAVWLGRVVFGLGWTAARDRHNLMPAARSAAVRLPHLRSYKAARQSVTTKP